jgi:hypothetical protein
MGAGSGQVPGTGGGDPGNAGSDSGNGGNDAAGGSPAGAGGDVFRGGAGGRSMGGGNATGGSDGVIVDLGFDSPLMKGSGTSSEQYETALVSRNDVPFVLITNGWGPGFDSHTVSWVGTSFIIDDMMGSAGPSGQPASYPTVFCGRYSVMQVPDCGLPAPRDSITSVKTGWRWAANGNEGQYNAAYDIWVGTGTRLEGYLMVWLRDPSGYQPAGSPNMAHQGVEVTNVPGTWNIWNGTVNGLPIINWVRAEGDQSTEIEFDVLDFLRDADARGLSYPGTHINAVAVGFEIWEGPVSNLETIDFYVDVQ